MSRFLKRAVFTLFLVLFLMVMAPDLLLIPFVLGFGWVFSIQRHFGAMGAGIGLTFPLFGFIALLLLAVGIHSFGRWISACRAATQEIPARPWRWRSSLAIFAGIWLTLFASMAFIGVLHQVGWLMVTDEPVFVRRLRFIREQSEMHNAARGLSTAAENADWQRTAILNAYWFDTDPKEPMWEAFDLQLDPNDEHIKMFCLKPRKPVALERIGGIIVHAATNGAAVVKPEMNVVEAFRSRIASNKAGEQ